MITTINTGTELKYNQVLKIFQARAEVFNIEQNVNEVDIDEFDFTATHIAIWDNNNIVAYTRVIQKTDGVYIGRVLVTKPFRKQNWGRKLMMQAIDTTKSLAQIQEIFIYAQLYLQKWYEQMGFVSVSEPFLEATIQHILMKLIVAR